MNGFDYAIIILMLLSIGVGIIRGAMREVMNIIGWVLAFIVAHAFAADLAPHFSDWVGEPVVRMVLAWTAIFAVVVIVASLVASLLSEVVKKLGLTTLDRGVGALIGLARGLLILLALTLALGMTSVPQSPLWKNAVLTPWLEVAAMHARAVLPIAIAEKIRFRAAILSSPKTLI